LFLINLYAINIIVIARKNQTKGDIKSDSITSIAFAQFGTTSIFQETGTKVIAIVTHNIHQIKECEDEAGIQKYQVAKFQIIADNKSEITTIIQNEVF
jgi:hypothetical protein